MHFLGVSCLPVLQLVTSVHVCMCACRQILQGVPFGSDFCGILLTKAYPSIPDVHAGDACICHVNNMKAGNMSSTCTPLFSTLLHMLAMFTTATAAALNLILL